jgi:hypothetical protein
MKWLIPFVSFSVLTITASASAQDTPAPTPAKSEGRGAFVAGAKVGGILPFDGLNPNLVGTLEVGYVFPWLHQSFGLLVDVGYAVPRKSGNVPSDVRVDGGKYDWSLTQKELTVAPTILFRLTKLGRVVPYIGVGPRIYFLRSIVEGKVGGATILETTEQSTKVGLSAPLGAEFRLGPGALVGEFVFEWGPLNHVATGDGTNTLGGNLQLGYRFMI